MKYNIIILIGLIQLGCSTTSHKIDNQIFSQNLIDKQKNKSSYFYITSTKKAKEAKTLTYFYTHSEPSQKLRNIFFNFAKKIGKKNGAIIISPNTNLQKQLKIIMEVSECSTIEPNLWPAVIFEDRIENNCYPFYLDTANEGKLLEVLSIINKALNDQTIIRKKQFIFNTKEDINKLINSYPGLNASKRVIFEFIDYLGNKIYS